LGVHIAAGTTYLAVVECPDTALIDDPADRLELAARLQGAEQLAEFAERVGQEVRRVEPIAVAVLYPKKYGQWKYADAFRRVSIEAAIMLATASASGGGRSIRFMQIKQERTAKLVEAGGDLPGFAGNSWGSQLPKYRAERALAFAVAMAAATEICP
jgi:hypothetical protein